MELNVFVSGKVNYSARETDVRGNSIKESACIVRGNSLVGMKLF